jgi:hypothetical protein
MPGNEQNKTWGEKRKEGRKEEYYCERTFSVKIRTHRTIVAETMERDVIRQTHVREL